MKIEMSIKDTDVNADVMNHIREKGVTVKVINNKLVLDLNNDIYTDIFDDKKFDIEVNIKAKDKTNKISLKDLKPGEHFFIDKNYGHEFIVLEQYEYTTFVISANNVIHTAEFGESSDWISSDIRRRLVDEYLPVIKTYMAYHHYLTFPRDLSVLDGSDIQTNSTYIEVISLLTFDEYRKYSHLINDASTNSYWLLTPYTTTNGTWKNRVLYYSRVLNTLDSIASDCHCGARPVMMFDNDIEVYKSTEV